MTTHTVITELTSDSSNSPAESWRRGFRKLCVRSLCLIACLGFTFSPVFAQLPTLKDLNPFKKDEFESLADKDLETTLDTPMIGRHTQLGGNSGVRVYGIGLVVNLKGTGDDPPVSTYRTQLKREMARKKIEDANSILRSPNTTLVEVKAVLPPLIQKGDLFDVEVHIPGNSEATDLNGGWLLETYLSEMEPVPGEGLKKVTSSLSLKDQFWFLRMTLSQAVPRWKHCVNGDVSSVGDALSKNAS
ncbi:MAG: flagellar basal body P-ring protein FlgI [Planctomycetaceae bacterium]